MFDIISDLIKDNVQVFSGLALMPFLAKILQSISAKMSGDNKVEGLIDNWSKAIDAAYPAIKKSVGVFAEKAGIFLTTWMQKNAIVGKTYEYFVEPLLFLLIEGFVRIFGKIVLLLVDLSREFTVKFIRGGRSDNTV